MAGVPPSELCFLSSLPAKKEGDKTRFLGCVTAYDTATAVLTLQHQHPPATRVRALVNVDLILERLSSEQVLVGEWVNVMGYVTAVVPAATAAAASDVDVHVQALLLWSAGPLDLQNYEKGLAELLSSGGDQQDASGVLATVAGG